MTSLPRRALRKLRRLSAARYDLARHRGRPRTVLSLPETPTVHSMIYLASARIGVRFVTACREPDAVMFWHDITVRPPEPRLTGFDKVINGECRDISKSTVSRAYEEAFGHALLIDPATHHGSALEKPERNAAHEGLEVSCPTVGRPGYTYQRLVNNVIHGGRMVEDLRVAVVGSLIPLAYRKLRPVGIRFSNDNATADLVDVGDVLSDEERSALLKMSELIGIDYAEYDCLRDRTDGRLYVVDANPTPSGPPNHLPIEDGRRAVGLIGSAFAAQFLQP